MGKLNNEVAVDGDENELVWTELDQNFLIQPNMPEKEISVILCCM